LLWSGRRGSNPRRPAWERVGWTCLQQLSVSGALYRLTASLAKSAFSSLTSSNRGFFEVQSTVIRTSFCAAFHGTHSRTVIGSDDNHGSPFCLLHFLLQQITAARQGWRRLPRYFNSNTRDRAQRRVLPGIDRPPYSIFSCDSRTDALP